MPAKSAEQGLQRLRQVFVFRQRVVEVGGQAEDEDQLRTRRKGHRSKVMLKDNMGWSGWAEFRNLTPNDKTNLQQQR